MINNAFEKGKNILNKVYLAGPITHAVTWESAINWRQKCEKELIVSNIQAISPLRHVMQKKRSGEQSWRWDDAYITMQCKNDIMRCDAVLANLNNSSKVSIGTIIEIAWANMLQKPIVVILHRDTRLYNEYKYGILNVITPVRVDNLIDGIDMIKELLSNH